MDRKGWKRLAHVGAGVGGSRSIASPSSGLTMSSGASPSLGFAPPSSSAASFSSFTLLEIDQ
eukprot:COSAG01_NODE_6950_length_3424_cov_3.280301_1_plen_62_part_00